MATKKIDDLTAAATGAFGDTIPISRGGVSMRTRVADLGVSRATAAQLAATGSASFDPTLLPFSSHSPWRLGIAQDAKFAPDTDARNVNLNNVAGSNAPYVNYYQFSHPVNVASTSDPLATVTDSYHPVGGTPTGGVWQENIPASAIIALGSDKHMHVITPDKKDVIEHFGTVRVDSTHYTTTRRHRVSLTGSGIGPQNGTRAYGGSALGGLIRNWEIDPADPNYTGRIDHPIAMALRLNQLYYSGEAGLPAFGGIYDENGYGQHSGFVWPASEQDGGSPTQYTGPIPMGSYFAIPPSVDIVALDLSAAGLMVAKAMQDYGAYVTDATGTTCIYVEDAGGTTAEQNFVQQLLAYSQADLKKLFGALKVVTSNGPSTPNGGPLGTARRGVKPSVATPAASTPPLGGPAAALTAAGSLTIGVPNTVDASAGAFTATLPTPTKVGQQLQVEKVDSSTNAVTVSGTIRGAATTIVLPGIGVPYESILFEAETLTSWRPIAGHKPKAWLDALYALNLEPVTTTAASGAAVTISNGVNDVTLTANAVLTFPALPAAGTSKTIYLKLRQDATGGRTVTWPASVKWPGGVAPVLSTGASKVDGFTFVSTDGASWDGGTSGLDIR